MEAVQRIQTAPKQVVQYFPYILGKTWNDTLKANMKELSVTEFANSDAGDAIVFLYVLCDS